MRRRLRTLDIQIYDDRLLAAADHHRFHRLIRTSIHLLVRDERRNVDEIARSGFLDEFEVIAPAEACTPTHDVQHCFEFAMMVRSRAGGRLHRDRSCPQLIGAGACMRDRSGSAHARSLRSIRIQIPCSDDPDAVIFPVRHVKMEP